MKPAISLLALTLLAAICGDSPSQQPQRLVDPGIRSTTAWRRTLTANLQTFGHRNWIVIADSAYPAQTRPGIQTIATRGDQLEIVKIVLDELAKVKHVRPVVYVDAELASVPEADAPGIKNYRENLVETLGGRKQTALPHEQMIAKLDKAAETFKVLLLKTNMTLPYTTVFLELDCGYWSPEAEKRLRAAMEAKAK